MSSEGDRSGSAGWQQVAGNQWRSIDVPPLDGSWRATDSVSVVIPAYGAQNKLDRTLAALRHQRYPQSLLQVIVADDGSSPPLTLPELAPENTELLRLERGQEWGPGRARHAGTLAAEGHILMFLDSDMIVFRDHVAAHTRWHHAIAEAVTLGQKFFADFDDVTPEEIAASARDGRLFDFAATRPHHRHEWIEEILKRTDELTVPEPASFMTAVTATLGVRADLYREAGGFRTLLRTGEDMEFAYRLSAVGAVFIPERQAQSWHQGPGTFMTRAEEVRRMNRPNFANYIPVPGYFRPWRPNRQYAVPMIDVIIETQGEQFEAIRSTVDAVLASDETDLHVELCCHEEAFDFGLARRLYGHDARVSLRNDTPETGFPSLYTVFLPDWAGLRVTALSRLVVLMEHDQLGVLHVVVPDAPVSDGHVTVWKTGALHRARRARQSGSSEESLAEIAGRLFGERWIHGNDVGVVNLRTGKLPRWRSGRRPSVPAVVEELSETTSLLAKTRRENTRLLRERRRLRCQVSELERLPSVRLERSVRKALGAAPRADVTSGNQETKGRTVTRQLRKYMLIGVAAVAGLLIGALIAALAARLGDTTLLVLLAALIGGASAVTFVSLSVMKRDTARESKRVQRALKNLRAEVTSSGRSVGEAGTTGSQQRPLSEADMRDVVAKQTQRTTSQIDRSVYWHFKQTEALLNLHSLIDVRGRLPASREYTASPDLLLAYVSEILTRRPSLIVECGSGLSTLWAGYAAERCGAGVRVVALEDAEEYVRGSRDLVAAHGLEGCVEIRHTPITAVDIAGEICPWYDPDLLHDLNDIGILFVDGPVGALATQARYPALPVLREKLAPGALIIVDDAEREEESALVSRWQEQWPELKLETLRHEKGTAFLHAPT